MRPTANSSARRQTTNSPLPLRLTISSSSPPSLSSSSSSPSQSLKPIRRLIVPVTNPAQTARLWKTVMTHTTDTKSSKGKRRAKIPSSGSITSTSASASGQRWRQTPPTLEASSIRTRKETAAKVTDADFMDAVLEPYGITIQNKDVICQEAAIPAWPGELVTTTKKKEHAENWVYESHKVRFESLRNLLPKGQDLKLELCVFHNLIVGIFSPKSEYIRKKYNFLEAIKSTYFHFKDAGADVKVRFEYFFTGEGMDVSWELDVDADAWKERGGRPIYVLNDTPEPHRQAWIDRIDAMRSS
ncbi:hypothetical protein GQ44DRAFT_725273 [Phaeosphaeriaceae sp. PMI808]|nr:hypothetical protein GQ44DRAFT_725273 [Phaeosphaeriaceae sp. PMI808]